MEIHRKSREDKGLSSANITLSGQFDGVWLKTEIRDKTDATFHSIIPVWIRETEDQTVGGMINMLASKDPALIEYFLTIVSIIDHNLAMLIIRKWQRGEYKDFPSYK